MKRWILWFLLMGIVLAQPPRAEISKALPSPCTLRSFRSSGDFVLANVGYGQSEGGGQVLMRRVEGRWRELTHGGGAMSQSELFLYGVPQPHWKALVGSQELPEGTSEPGWPDTARRLLPAQELDNRSAWELTLMRNEIFARHGRAFKDPLLREYFVSRPWYRPNPGFVESSLSDTERRNASTIQNYQNRTGKIF